MNSEMENERRKSSRSTAIISNIIQQDKIGEKNLRKEIRKALKAEIKSEAQGLTWFTLNHNNNHVLRGVAERKCPISQDYFASK